MGDLVTGRGVTRRSPTRRGIERPDRSEAGPGSSRLERASQGNLAAERVTDDRVGRSLERAGEPTDVLSTRDHRVRPCRTMGVTVVPQVDQDEAPGWKSLDEPPREAAPVACGPEDPMRDICRALRGHSGRADLEVCGHEHRLRAPARDPDWCARRDHIVAASPCNPSSWRDQGAAAPGAAGSDSRPLRARRRGPARPGPRDIR